MCALGLDPDEPGILREGSPTHPSFSHGSCRNAERYVLSICTDVDKKKKSGEPKAKDALDKLKATDVKKYREKIMECVVSGKARRGATKQQQLWHHAQLTVVYIYYVRIRSRIYYRGISCRCVEADLDPASRVAGDVETSGDTSRPRGASRPVCEGDACDAVHCSSAPR